MFEMIFNTHYDSPWSHLDNDEVLQRRWDPVGYLSGLFFSFEGRIGRLEYIAGNVTLFAVLMSVYLGTGLAFGLTWLDIVITASFVPAAWAGLALEVKRWHDQGRSGWWVLLGVVPFVGGFAKFAMLTLVPSDGPNDYDVFQLEV